MQKLKVAEWTQETVLAQLEPGAVLVFERGSRLVVGTDVGKFGEGKKSYTLAGLFYTYAPIDSFSSSGRIGRVNAIGVSHVESFDELPPNFRRRGLHPRTVEALGELLHVEIPNR